MSSPISAASYSSISWTNKSHVRWFKNCLSVKKRVWNEISTGASKHSASSSAATTTETNYGSYGSGVRTKSSPRSCSHYAGSCPTAFLPPSWSVHCSHPKDCQVLYEPPTFVSAASSSLWFETSSPMTFEINNRSINVLPDSTIVWLILIIDTVDEIASKFQIRNVPCSLVCTIKAS